MGWFWDSKPANDPYKNLDPSLREFLDKESPSRHEDSKPTATPTRHSSQPRAPPATPDPVQSLLQPSAPEPDSQRSDAAPSDGAPAVPGESLFQDGRYAHLWKGYRPQAEVDYAGQTDQDRLSAIVQSYNDRKAAIGRAAIENCVDYQIAEKECFSNGSWAQRMTMCREENRAFIRCYTMQSRFLKALGYLSQHRTEEDEERIQMHADKLYDEMLKRERVAQEAKEHGHEAPALPPLIQPDSTTKALGEDSAWARARQKAMDAGTPTTLSSLPPVEQEEIRKRIGPLGKEERELELQLTAAENRAQLEYAEQIRDHLEEDRVKRAERRERGKATIGDTIKRLWGWDR